MYPTFPEIATKYCGRHFPLCFPPSAPFSPFVPTLPPHFLPYPNHYPLGVGKNLIFLKNLTSFSCSPVRPVDAGSLASCSSSHQDGSVLKNFPLSSWTQTLPIFDLHNFG